MHQRSKRFGKFNPARLYAYKGPVKPEHADIKPTVSGYAGVNNAGFSTDFGSGTSGITGTGKNKTYQTTATLSPQLAGIGQTAATGLGNNLQFLQQDPNQRVGFMTSGQDPTYNVLNEQADRARQEAIGRQLVDGHQGGITNSTTMGSALGKITNDDLLRRNQILLSALDYGNQTAQSNAGINMNTISGLNGLITPLGSAAASQLQTAKGSQDAANAATVAAQNSEATRYAGLMDAYNKQQSQQAFGGALGAYGNFIDPLGFSVNPAKATGQFIQIAGTAAGGFGGLGAGMGASSGIGPVASGAQYGAMLAGVHPSGSSYFNQAIR